MIKEIYLAGGCFWGSQAFLDKIPGVVSTQVGYANGKRLNVTYEEVCHDNTGHAETVFTRYDAAVLPTEKLLSAFFEIIDPVSLNRQGGDKGEQYRTGIYYTDEADLPVIKKFVEGEQKKYKAPVVTEVKPLENYSPAEEYHQKYLQKNPGGYCHVDLNKADKYKLSLS